MKDATRNRLRRQAAQGSGTQLGRLGAPMRGISARRGGVRRVPDGARCDKRLPRKASDFCSRIISRPIPVRASRLAVA